MGSVVNVVILDAHDLSRHGMMMILAQAPNEVRVVKTLSEQADLEASLRQSPCDVLLLDDAAGTVLDVIEVLRLVRQMWPEVSVIILSQMLHQGYIQQLTVEGAKGFLYKGDRLEEILLLAIRTVMRDELYLSPRASALPYQSHSANINTLGVREFQVLQLLSIGLTVSEIAKSLHIHIKMVYKSRDRLRDGLGVRTNEQIVPTAHSRGLL